MTTGTVEAISEKITKNGKKRYGYLISGEWYNSFKPFKVVKGQKVEVTFEKTSYGNMASKIAEHKDSLDLFEPEAKPKQEEKKGGILSAFGLTTGEQQEQEKRLRLLEIAARLFNIDNPQQAIEKAEQMRRYVETGKTE